MKLDSSCSEERMDRALRGMLPAADMIEFTTHLTTCPDCRMAWRMATDFQGSGGAMPGDERIVERAARAALAMGRRPARRWVSAVPAAAALVVAAGVASGAIALRARYLPPREDARPLPVALRHSGRPGAMDVSAGARMSPESAGADTPEPPSPPPAPSLVASEPSPLVPPGIAGANATAALPKKRPRTRPIALAPTVPASYAPVQPPAQPSQCAQGQELLAQAVHHRNEGDADAAVESFRRLQAACVGLPEAMVSLVSTGELLLERGAASEALASFDAYLRGAPSGTLAPEALVGQARALVRLGRLDEAEGIWREVARRFPQSPYARRVPAGMKMNRAATP